MGSRLDAYRALLDSILRAGYRIISVGDFWEEATAGDIGPSERCLVLRHDVDTDPRTAARMWRIDRDLGVQSSYFFRLSTLAPELMVQIADEGGESSYHYEELATIIKRRGLRRPTDVAMHIPEARELFAENLARLRTSTGLPMRVVASHGDFVNRYLGIANWTVLDDPGVRRVNEIELETYDDAFLRLLPSRHIDCEPPRFWEPADPAIAVRADVPVISVVVHPRQWFADPVVNARDDLQRTVEEVRFAISSRRELH